MPKPHRAIRLALLAGLAWLWIAVPALALIMVGKGNDPVKDPGWVPGSLAVANLKSRVGWTEGPPFGGGQWTFYYRGGVEQLQAAVDAFAKIAADKLEVVLHDGRGSSHIDKEGYDWSFEVWVRDNWERLFNNPDSFFATDHPNFGKKAATPRLDIWLHRDGPDWLQIKVPKHLAVQDQRATGNGFPPGSGSVIRLTVTDYQGKPIPTARLQITATGGGKESAPIKESSADGQGVILATGILAGTFRISVAAPDYAPRLIEYNRYGSNDYRVFTTRLAPAVTLIGRTVDEEGNPLAKVTVQPAGLKGPDGLGYQSPESAKAISDDTGQFQLAGLPAGKLQVQARLAGYHYVWDPKEVMEARDDNKTGSPTCVLKLVPTGIVHVQLVDAQNQPFKPARLGDNHVHIQDADRTGIGSWGGGSQVDTNGACEFTTVPPGRYRLSSKPFPEKGQPPDINEIIITVPPRRTVEVKLMK